MQLQVSALNPTRDKETMNTVSAGASNQGCSQPYPLTCSCLTKQGDTAMIQGSHLGSSCLLGVLRNAGSWTPALTD